MINKLTYIITLLLLTALLSGCGTGYRATPKAALYSNFAPCITVMQVADTNLINAAGLPVSRSDLAASADVRAPLIICAEQLYISLWGGAAPSNSVLSDLQIPLTEAP